MEMIWFVVRLELASEVGLMVTSEVDGSNLWCIIWDSAANLTSLDGFSCGYS